MTSYKLAILAGDGIGPEITKESLKVLDAVQKKFDIQFEYIEAAFGGAGYDKYGHPFAPETQKVCDQADAILKGPIGGPKYDQIEDVNLRPERGALLPLRKRYQTYANYRPVRLPLSLEDASPIKKERLGEGVDILMIRELVGGIYFGKKERGSKSIETESGRNGETANEIAFALDVMEYNQAQIERIARLAFNEAKKKKAKLHNIHKQNVLQTSVFWNEVVDRIHQAEFSDVELEHMLVDNAAYQLVINPSQFSVMLLENMMGDILTDQAGGILGSLGLMPSACVGPEKAYYEPAHGSAPTIAGKNIANPYSMIGSVALMLEKSFNQTQAADAVWDALFSVFGDGFRTQELANVHTPENKVISTSDFGDRVVEKLLS